MHPMLDQTMIGTVIEQAGVGRRVGKGDSPLKLRPVIEQMLTDGPHRAGGIGACKGVGVEAIGGAPYVA